MRQSRTEPQRQSGKKTLLVSKAYSCPSGWSSAKGISAGVLGWISGALEMGSEEGH